MSRIAFGLAAAFALAGASAADAGAAIDVPAQVFPHDPAGSNAKPVVTPQERPLAAFADRGPIAGRNFGVNLPIPGVGGAKGRLPLTLHVLSSEEECHDNGDVNGDPQRQDQDFIRGGEH